MNYDRTGEGAIAMYSCDPSFELVDGDRTRTCGKNGNWIGKPAMCSKFEKDRSPKFSHEHDEV